MRYIRIHGGTGYCSQDFEDFLETDKTDGELDKLVEEMARENAEQYDYTVWGWGVYTAEEYAEESGVSIEEAEQMMEEYYSEAYANWEEITKEEYEENV